MTGNSSKSEIIGMAGYFAKITKQEGGSYLVEFPDLPGCLTEGETIGEARSEAQEAMSAWLYAAIKAGDELPAPKQYLGARWHLITPEIDVAIPLTVIRARVSKGLTQQQVAEQMGISQQAYRKLEIPGKSNPTIKTLARLGEVLGFELVVNRRQEA